MTMTPNVKKAALGAKDFPWDCRHPGRGIAQLKHDRTGGIEMKRGKKATAAAVVMSAVAWGGVVSASPAVASAGSAPATAAACKVAQETLNIREKPSRTAKKIGTLYKGRKLCAGVVVPGGKYEACGVNSSKWYGSKELGDEPKRLGYVVASCMK
jgi:hypothetical protein